MKRRSSPPSPQVPDLDWHHDGVLHRVRLADPVAFERQPKDTWEEVDLDPMSETFASAALCLSDDTWDGFIRNLPFAMREFLRLFHFERLEALAVVSRCPELLPELEAAPALTLFLAAHVALRGTDGPRWSEIRAVYERGGIYAVLEWLGLPSSPQTMAILAEIPDPEIPRHELAPLRAALWAGAGCHPLAA